MKKVILLAWLVPFSAFGQVFDNFESGRTDNWVQSTEGHWKADSVTAISGKYSLHHIFDSPDAGTDRIGIQIKNLHPSQGLTKWSFTVRYGYDPSSLNNWSVFLLSDSDPLSMSQDGSTNGFALGVNLTGSDDSLRLWKVKGNVLTTVLNCHINWQTDIGTNSAVKIIVERSIEGSWTVSAFHPDESMIKSTSASDCELFNSSWFGVYYRYSSTRDRLLWIDDVSIEGYFFEDKEAPVVTACKASGRNSADITLNEEPSDDFISPDNFSLEGEAIKSISVNKEKVLSYRLEFTNMLINKAINNLHINNLCDKAGNCAQNITMPFNVEWAEPGDVIISEIMADPLPEVSLPGKEYIEILNRTEFSYSLKNWKLSADAQYVLFPDTIILPSEILILCLQQDTALFKKFGRVLGLKQFPTLSDGGRILCLSDSSGILIHGVEYSSGWYKDELKSGGGWSLEMIDTDYPFYYDGNWIASSSRKGGTPGSVNSVSQSNTDISFYGVQNVFPDDSTNIIVRFSEPVLALQEDTISITIDGKEVLEISAADPLFREFSVKTEKPLLPGKIYQLSVSGEIKDYAGNIIQMKSFAFGLPEAAEKGDIKFNEILFNPLPGDQDYIELFNCSDKTLDASRIQIVSVNDDLGDTSAISLVSAEKRCILPHAYYALTTDKEKISDRYFSADIDCLFETTLLPSMPDDEGHLVLYNRELDVIDELHYNEKMQYSLLSQTEGVALEKTRTDYNSDVESNWHSASQSSGWGTPGAPNSVTIENPVTSDNVILSSTKITPDNNGSEDFLVINFNLAGNGNVITVTVFDETGSFVKKIVTNMLAGAEASVIWDGTAADGTLVDTGIYIVFITLYDETGKQKSGRKYVQYYGTN